MDHTTQGWVLATASGVACVLGASVVFADVLLSRFFRRRYYAHIMHNKAFLVASLSLASGIMIYSSFNTLLPQAQKHLAQSKHFAKYTRVTALAFYFTGVLGSALITLLAHKCMEHALEEKSMVETSDVDVVVQSTSDEQTPLIAKHPGSPGLGVGSPTSAHGNGHSVCVAEPAGENSATNDECVHHHHHHHHHPHSRKGDVSRHVHDHHHHHFSHLFHAREDSTEDRKQLMRIGIQTAIAISIHKFPEGLIMFITSQASRSLGFAFFIAIALHNISEGFSIALPLYIATRSRIKSFLYASVLGGMSQPLGALLGWLFVGSLRQWDHHGLYGIIFSCVSGLMSLISIQGMLPQAMKNDTSNGQTVTIFFFLGILVMGVSQALTDLYK